MSKLIVEMEMPKRCIKCGVRLKCKLYVCGLQQDIAENLKPLIGDKDCLITGVLPDEHGDLIDRDVASKAFSRAFDECDKDVAVFSVNGVVSVLECQTAVIAAERKDDAK